MPVITLTTEWKPNDFYYGIIRGKLSARCPDATVIVNAGGIPALNIAHASFVIRNTYENYPKGSVHIICVHSEAEKGKDCLLVRARDHFFIGTDNGIFNLILNSEPDEMIKIGGNGSTDELEIFASAAANVYLGKKLSEIGTPVKEMEEKLPLRATIEKNLITGSIIFIDSYGNAISNITKEVFYRVFGDTGFRILIQSNRNHTGRISSKYSDVPVGELLARFNQLDLLEIALNGANVSELLSISIGSVVRIEAPNKPGSPNRLL
ncbi:MAG TPA: SAM-dependent chlorinase/fluorinase [Bacteroidales bacterium]|nr:SAM-dependent chlorinase/fluorinase [Bacteroidales bacterium]